MKATHPEHRIRRARRIREAMLRWELREYSIDAIITACHERSREFNVPMTCVMAELEAAALRRHDLALFWLSEPAPRVERVVYREPSRLERIWSRVVAVVQWVRRLGD